MGAVASCFYRECYYNHNVKHRCMIEKVTLDFWGTCENIMHCDEYECNTCERFQICTKDKKKAFGSAQSDPHRVVLRYPASVKIEYCDNSNCIYFKNSKCHYSGGITLDSNASCQMAEYKGEENDFREDEDSSSLEDLPFDQI